MSQNTLVVTGATGGVGHALLRAIEPTAYRVALVSRDRDRLDAVMADLPDGLEAFAIAADVSQPQGAEAAFAEATEQLGEAPTHLAHCAGTTLLAPLHRTTDAQYRDCLAANLDSAFFTLRAWVQGRVKARDSAGAAVLFSSVVSLIGVSNHEAIAAAKGAVASLIPAAAATYAGQGIRINGIAPGLTRTGATERLFAAKGAEAQITAQYPLGRYAQAEDQAHAAAWLLSDQAGWITGQVLPVDGGFTTVRPMVRLR
ncbi:SDR family NAD(P)-dependent oxidoreductase [Thioalkalivibrio sp.]|uniref:SDR family NAD(P)-dependent oxidoreductase n=1 Tax=Thioalkalivibrio sp. TaxID=2093813 RepID=UPI003976189C